VLHDLHADFGGDAAQPGKRRAVASRAVCGQCVSIVANSCVVSDADPASA